MLEGQINYSTELGSEHITWLYLGQDKTVLDKVNKLPCKINRGDSTQRGKVFFTMTLLHTAWFFGSLERVELSVAVKSKHTQSNFDKTHWPTIGTKIVETPSSNGVLGRIIQSATLPFSLHSKLGCLLFLNGSLYTVAQACLGEGSCGEEKASFSPFEVGKSHKVP